MPDPLSDSLLEQEFAEPFNTWQQKQTPENSATLLKTIHPVLTSAIRQFGIQNSPTMQSRARIIALGAMKRYDPSKAKLRTYLLTQLQGLRRHAAKELQILSVPEQVALDLGHTRNAENELRDKLGRDPSEMELSEHTKLSPKRLSYIRHARPSMAESAFNRSTDEGDDVYSPPIQVPTSNVKHWHELVYHDLSPVDQLIMEHTFGMHDKPILQNIEVARKVGVSPGAISQRKARIQQKLDLRDELRVI